MVSDLGFSKFYGKWKHDIFLIFRMKLDQISQIFKQLFLLLLLLLFWEKSRFDSFCWKYLNQSSVETLLSVVLNLLSNSLQKPVQLHKLIREQNYLQEMLYNQFLGSRKEGYSMVDWITKPLSISNADPISCCTCFINWKKWWLFHKLCC